MDKQEIIEYLRSAGFNCFPMPENSKAADNRYKAAETAPNQPISDMENYGIIPNETSCIIDCDDKEKFRAYAQKCIDHGMLVTESPHGWHIYVKGLSGQVQKEMLFLSPDDEKQIVDIQGPKSFCVGPYSKVDGLDYKVNFGKIMDAKGCDFNVFIDRVCVSLGVEKKFRNTSSHSQMLNKQFTEGKLPGKGTSNEYFFHAALVCNTEGLSREDAISRIRIMYDRWAESETFSGRPWSNIEAKINDVYDNDYTIKHGGSRKTTESEEELADKILSDNSLYSDKKTRFLYKTDNGFLEDITVEMESILTNEHHTGRTRTAETMHFLIGKAKDLPEVDKNMIRFKNGVFDLKTNEFNTDKVYKICILGFPDYDYHEDANPVKFLEMIKSQVKQSSFNDLKAWLCKVPTPRKEIRMAVCYGEAGTGKTALAEVLQHSLTPKYSKAVTMGDYFKDMATRAGVIGKTMLYFQDAPKKWEQIDKLKQLTGENQLPVRELYKESEMSKNMLNIIISTNNLPKIANDDAGPMFDRVTLIEFEDKKIRGTENDNENWAEDIADMEGEQIISYCLNLRKENYRFLDSKQTKLKWTEISCPEFGLINKLFRYEKGAPGLSKIEIKEYLEQNSDVEIDLTSVMDVLKQKGYAMVAGIYKDISKVQIAEESLDNYENSS